MLCSTLKWFRNADWAVNHFDWLVQWRYVKCSFVVDTFIAKLVTSLFNKAEKCSTESLYRNPLHWGIELILGKISSLSLQDTCEQACSMTDYFSSSVRGLLSSLFCRKGVRLINAKHQLHFELTTCSENSCSMNRVASRHRGYRNNRTCGQRGFLVGLFEFK